MSDETNIQPVEVEQLDAQNAVPEVDKNDPDLPEDERVQTSEDEDKSNPEKEPWYKRRINELTRDKHEARRQAERLEKVLEQQEQLLRQLSPQQTQEQVSLIPPSPDDYVGGQFDPRYLQDMMQYTRESAKAEAIEAVKREQQETMQRQAMMQQQQRLETAEAAARAKYQDYDTVIESITSDPRLAQNETIRQALLGLDNGPEIAYTLGRNLDVAYEIANMNPIQAGMRIAEIINRAPRKTTNVPNPIRPIAATGGTPGSTKSYEEMSTAEYIAARNAEELARRQSMLRR